MSEDKQKQGRTGTRY